MKRFLLLCSLLAAATASTTAFAQTTVYSYVSQPYSDINEVEITPEPIAFAPFTEQMRLRGSITAPQPFPPDLDAVSIGPNTDYPVTWSFNNGLGTFTNNNSSLISGTLSTDENGDILGLQFQAFSPLPPYENNQNVSGFVLIYASSQSPLPIEGIAFSNLKLCVYDEDEPDNECEQFDETSALAGFSPSGTWSRSTPAATAVPVPGMGGLAVVGLGALMVGLAARRSQRSQQRVAAD